MVSTGSRLAANGTVRAPAITVSSDSRASLSASDACKPLQRLARIRCGGSVEGQHRERPNVDTGGVSRPERHTR